MFPYIMYRATQHLDSYILLTSKQKFPWLVGRYCSYLLLTQALSTFNLMSTEYRNQGAVSPCISDRSHETKDLMSLGLIGSTGTGREGRDEFPWNDYGINRPFPAAVSDLDHDISYYAELTSRFR